MQSPTKGTNVKTMLRTTATLAALSLATPAFAFSVWPDVDFEWYATLAKYDARAVTVESQPLPREGYIWSPERWETGAVHQKHIAAHWVVDDYYAQLAIYNHPPLVADAR
jgi:hypothetical protein